MRRLLTAGGERRGVFLLSVFLCAAAVPFFFASAAWADAKNVAAAIHAYASGDLRAVPAGNRVTVTGTKAGAKTPLSLDITGVTVVWNAALSGNFRAARPGSALVLLSGRGNFDVSPSGVIFNDASADIAAVELRNGAALSVGGTVGATGSRASAIYSRHGGITVEKGGKVQAPRGAAIRTYAHAGDRPELSSVTLKDTAGLVGEAAVVKDGRRVSTFYGSTVIDSGTVFDTAFSDGADKRPLLVIAEKAEVALTRSARFTEGEGVDMKIEKGGSLLSGGTVTLRGTLQNDGEISNSGTFVNKGMFANRGTIVNTGTIVNDETLENAGTLDTEKGKIVNNGVIDNARGKIKGTKNISGRGKIIAPYRDGGGCSAGLGLAGLAASAGAGMLGILYRTLYNEQRLRRRARRIPPER
ncbi:MAG: hypothetical protein LBO82_02405 [Synergistaceae bacterium]|jgi:hypothetical protein|nr:hypothetical protein [Synergistaceae bacterium]